MRTGKESYVKKEIWKKERKKEHSAEMASADKDSTSTKLFWTMCLLDKDLLKSLRSVEMIVLDKDLLKSLRSVENDSTVSDRPGASITGRLDVEPEPPVPRKKET